MAERFVHTVSDSFANVVVSGEHGTGIAWRSKVAHAINELLGRHRRVPDRASENLRESFGHFEIIEGLRSRDVVGLAVMTGFGQGRDGDVCDIVGVDEGEGGVPKWQGEVSIAQQCPEPHEIVVEVLSEPTGANNRPFGAR